MFRRKRSADDFSAEIEAHLQLEIDRLQEQGLSYEQARTAAYRAFGNTTRARERFYESNRWIGWDNLCQDVRFAWRMLRKSAGFTAVAVLTIALGIGATTAIFSVVNATLLRPLPYPNPEQLVEIEDDLPGIGSYDIGLSQPEWQDLQHSGIFQYVSPAWFDENNLTGVSQPARVSLLIVAPNYFALLGVKPQLGRIFDPNNYSPGFVGEVLISDGLWKRSFGSDPHILDKTLRLDTDLYHIVGVMPPGFHAPGRSPAERNTEVWAAYSFFGPPMSAQQPRSQRFLPEAIARLKPGLTLVQAQQHLDALVASLRQQYPADYPAQAGWRVRLLPLKETLVGNVRQSLILLLGAVAVVLLIGCVNIANLLLARASAREREVAIRQALGAARARLIRQFMTESLLLSLLGGMVGIGLLLATKDALLRLVPSNLPQLNRVSIDWSVLLFALGASLICGMIFGLAPALPAGRLDVTSGLKEVARGATGSGKQARTRRALVITELGLSLVLMIAACLLLRSFWDLLNAPLGFNPASAMTIRTRLPYPNDPKLDRYATAAQEAPFLHELLRRTRALPGVEEVALGDSGAIPLDQSQKELNLLAQGHYFFQLEGREIQRDQAPWAERVMVTPEYFHLLRIPLLRGRLFDEFDDDKKPSVAVIDEAFARTFWPNENAIGKRFRSTRAESPWVTVIGVVANTRTDSLAESAVPQIYSSLYQTGTHHLAIFLRGKLDPAVISRQVRQQVQSIDPRLPVFGAQKIEDAVTASVAERRFSLQMVGLFAFAALVLAAIGIYGVISYMVGARTREIGIRLALGASRATILQMVLRQGLSLAAIGAAAGLVAALVVAQLMSRLVYGIRPTDLATFAGVAALLIAVAALACYLPARRAVKVDPTVALRCD
ncbi:MAG TPA: ABC transporter permease [Terriglobales bacterium]|nr:ABC transporter permease [Terriglobales bacterium]